MKDENPQTRLRSPERQTTTTTAAESSTLGAGRFVPPNFYQCQMGGKLSFINFVLIYFYWQLSLFKNALLMSVNPHP